MPLWLAASRPSPVRRCVSDRTRRSHRGCASGASRREILIETLRRTSPARRASCDRRCAVARRDEQDRRSAGSSAAPEPSRAARQRDPTARSSRAWQHTRLSRPHRVLPDRSRPPPPREQETDGSDRQWPDPGASHGHPSANTSAISESHALSSPAKDCGAGVASPFSWVIDESNKALTGPRSSQYLCAAASTESCEDHVFSHEGGKHERLFGAASSGSQRRG
jgi:hypothetical protein